MTILDRLQSAAEEVSARTFLRLGIGGGLAPLAFAALPWTTLPVDVVLVAFSPIAPMIAWVGLLVRARVDALPLEIAPTVGTGHIDGVRVYRFRVRLGRGRRAASPSATVSFEDADGETYALAARVPADEVIGPFTIVCPDPEHTCAGPGRFHVEVTCVAQGRSWNAAAVLDKSDVAEGWFAGVEPDRSTVRFTPQWSAMSPEATWKQP